MDSLPESAGVHGIMDLNIHFGIFTGGIIHTLAYKGRWQMKILHEPFTTEGV